MTTEDVTALLRARVQVLTDELTALYREGAVQSTRFYAKQGSLWELLCFAQQLGVSVVTEFPVNPVMYPRSQALPELNR